MQMCLTIIIGTLCNKDTWTLTFKNQYETELQKKTHNFCGVFFILDGPPPLPTRVYKALLSVLSSTFYFIRRLHNLGLCGLDFSVSYKIYWFYFLARLRCVLTMSQKYSFIPKSSKNWLFLQIHDF
jgi:hypothetical protein